MDRKIYISLPEELVMTIDRIAEGKYGRIERSKVIRRLIEIGLKEALKDVDKFEEEVVRSG